MGAGGEVRLSRNEKLQTMKISEKIFSQPFLMIDFSPFFTAKRED
jgi:hypothetical protein